MLAINNNLKHSLFDELFFNLEGNYSRPRSRRVKSRSPEKKVSKTLQPRRELTSKPSTNGLRVALLVNDDFFNGESSLFNDTNRFFNNQCEVQEDTENYLVSYKDTDMKNKELDVKYVIKDQKLVISSKMKKCDKYNYENANSKSTFSSTSERRIRLNIPVNHEAIKATIENDCLKLTIPKLETDDNIFRIEIDENNSKDKCRS